MLGTNKHTNTYTKHGKMLTDSNLGGRYMGFMVVLTFLCVNIF